MFILDEDTLMDIAVENVNYVRMLRTTMRRWRESDKNPNKIAKSRVARMTGSKYSPITIAKDVLDRAAADNTMVILSDYRWDVQEAILVERYARKCHLRRLESIKPYHEGQYVRDDGGVVEGTVCATDPEYGTVEVKDSKGESWHLDPVHLHFT